MIINWENFGFCVEVTDGGHFDVACGNSEGTVLDCLESIEGGGGSIRVPDGGGIGE